MNDRRTPPMIDLTRSLPHLHASLTPPAPPRRRGDPIAPMVGDDLRPDPSRDPAGNFLPLTLAAIFVWALIITAYYLGSQSSQ